ncbi:electron transfer flavoprotein subunit beta/FixA family protein [Cnuibacter physcomitrellae]|uniref:electron transfer flavoprotein subunit beta/FixA family protein n=1 Tax=Cnuibacter physcomitrellae TaxID=1619308 RepID=UPI002175D953|nr:electron transfer flavoprotein subunit beta/FixA family protein [Cnuibacter physcomitrellae]MCS5498236.1 electron transfer flavoprotein subunit beta/FixA family protein [Cnuibacter physcomitrellae]
MKIVVLMKEVPDTYGERTLDLATGLAEREGAEKVLDEIGERALEAALVYRDADPTAEIVALSVGPASVPGSLRKALAMGADSAVHVLDDGLVGADLTLTAEVLAAAIARLEADVVVAGNLSTDGSGGVIPAMVAEHLGRPHLTSLTSWSLDPSTVTGVRAGDGATLGVSAPLPAVVSITESFPDPRFPAFKGIMAAKKKPFDTWTLDDLGVSAAADLPRSIMTAVAERPARAAGVKITDQGDAGEKLADFLLENRLA